MAPRVTQRGVVLTSRGCVAVLLLLASACAESANKAPRVAPPPFEVGAIIRKAQLAFRQDGSGALTGRHPTYTVSIGTSGAATLVPIVGAAEGLQSSRDPSSRQAPTGAGGESPGQGAACIDRQEPGGPLTVVTESITRGEVTLAQGRGRAGLGADAEARVLRGEVVERFRNSDDGVEQSWTFPHEPAGWGDLEVRVRMDGLTYRGRTEHGLHFAASGGPGFRYGRATWVDGKGTASELEMGFDGGTVVIRVPAGILAASAYPAVLDPVIAPETGIDTPVIAPALGHQTNPAVASSGAAWLVVWEDSRNVVSPGGNTDIYGARVSDSGAILDPGGIAISTAPRGQYGPVVTPLGAGWFVAWQDERDSIASSPAIYGARVTEAGEVLDRAGIPVATGVGQSAPSVASNGVDCLVVWTDSRNLQDYWDFNVDIYGARVSTAGVVLDAAGLAISTSRGGQTVPVVASSGTDWLVTWQDWRDYQTGGADVYGARVSGAGEVLDPGGIAISRLASNELSPAVASNGAGWLVVWEDYRNNAPDAYQSDLYGARVSPAGMVLEPEGISISSATNGQLSPTVAANGATWMVVWQDDRNDVSTNYARNYDIYGTRLSATGQVLDPLGVAVTTEAQSTSPALASNDMDWLVVWADDRHSFRSGSDVLGARVSGSGTVVEAEGIPVSAGANQQGYPAVASNGTEWLVVWGDDRDDPVGGSTVYGARVSATGEVLDPAGIALSHSSFGSGLAAPSVAANGTDWLVIWTDPRGLFAARVSRSGVALDPEGIAVAPWAASPAVASNGLGWLAVWQDYRTRDIYGARVDPEGVVLDRAGIAISAALDGQYAPAVASNGSEWLVVWHDYRDASTTGGADIFGARVADGGLVLDPLGIPIARAANGQLAPAVASNGTEWLVVWEDGRDPASGSVHGARVSGTGVVLDPAGIPVSTAPGGQSSPAIATSGPGWLVVWQDHRNGSMGSSAELDLDIYGARVDETGQVLDPDGIVLSTEAGSEVTPAIAPGAPGRHLLVYGRARHEAPFGGSPRVLARLVTTSASLTIGRSGTGAGTVTSTPAGIDCGTTCSHTFDIPVEVTLTAFPGAGSRFAGWTGQCSGTSAVVSLTVDDTGSCGAIFVEPLVITSGSGGTVSLPTGTELTLTATGGLPPYDWTIDVNNSGASISPPGVYTAGTATGRDTVSVTDATGATASLLVVVSPAEGPVSSPSGQGCSQAGLSPAWLMLPFLLLAWRRAWR